MRFDSRTTLEDIFDRIPATARMPLATYGGNCLRRAIDCWTALPESFERKLGLWTGEAVMAHRCRTVLRGFYRSRVRWRSQRGGGRVSALRS